MVKTSSKPSSDHTHTKKKSYKQVSECSTHFHSDQFCACCISDCGRISALARGSSLSLQISKALLPVASIFVSCYKLLLMAGPIIPMRKMQFCLSKSDLALTFLSVGKVGALISSLPEASDPKI